MPDTPSNITVFNLPPKRSLQLDDRREIMCQMHAMSKPESAIAFKDYLSDGQEVDWKVRSPQLDNTRLFILDEIKRRRVAACRQTSPQLKSRFIHL